MTRTPIVWRDEVRPEDEALVEHLCRSSGFFSEDEVLVAMELVRERLAKGPASGYHFLFAQIDGRDAAYACYGPIACTLDSWDLFWVAVDQPLRGHGLGHLIMLEAEKRIAQAGGSHVYVETSSKDQYQPTRNFYENLGYRKQAQIPDFYAPKDDKVIYAKSVRPFTSPNREPEIVNPKSP